MHKKIKFIDENLIGQDGLCKYISPKTEWIKDKEYNNYDIAIYTDKQCFKEKLLSSNKTNYAWIIEPPIINGENYLYIKRDYSKYKKIFSYVRSLQDEIPNFQFIPHGGTWLREEDISLHVKNKNISFICSDKIWNGGHRFRHGILKKVKNNNRWNVEFFGSGTENPINFKIDALKHYKFSISIENSQENDYFTEKIIDCFLTYTVPIYYGTKNIHSYFNKNGILTFNNYNELFKILDSINDDTYEKMKESMDENFELAKNYIHPEKIIEKCIQDG